MLILKYNKTISSAVQCTESSPTVLQGVSHEYKPWKIIINQIINIMIKVIKAFDCKEERAPFILTTS